MRRHATWIVHVAQPHIPLCLYTLAKFPLKHVYAVAYADGCCHPPLAGSAFRVPPVPGRHAPGSMEKIKSSCGHPQDIGIILHSPFRRQIAKLKIKARRNEITVRTKSRQICRGEAGASEMRPYQGCATDLHPALSSPSATPLRSGGYAGKVKRADGTSASADATKKNAPCGR